MKKQIAYLEYTFIFDPSETFQSGTKFEKFLSDFFNDMGYEAEVVETVGNASRRVLSITKATETMEFDKKAPPKSIQQSMKEVHKNIPTGKKK
jgi:hypothetical protein